MRWLPLVLFPYFLLATPKIKQKVELGYFGTTGNTNIHSLTAAYRYKHRIDKKNRIEFWTDVFYSTRNGKKSSERYRMEFDFYHYKNSRFYYYTQLAFLRNTFEGYNQQYNFTPGIGYKLIKTKKNKFDILLGYQFRRNNYTRGGSENFNYIKGELKFLHKFTKRNNYDFKLSFIENIETSKDFESQLITNLRLWIVKSFHFKITFELKYDNLPPSGKRKTDTITKASIVYSF